MTDITPTAPITDKPAEPQAPAPTPGQAAAPVDDLPEKFKGKSAAEIAKSYLELEKTHGKSAEELGKSREEIAQWKALGQVIGGKPELKKAIQDEIDRISGKAPAKPGEPEAPKRDDVRISQQDMIINKFEDDRGLRLIPLEKKQELDKAMGRELVDMLDPTDTKSPSEIIESIPVDRLPKYLEKAYLLAIAGDKEERTRSQEFVEAKRNAAATIGSMPSSGVNSSDFSLTPGEKEAARRMNISEEDYIKQKKEIAKEYN